MRILLSQFRYPDDRLERQTLGREGELIVQTGSGVAWSTMPDDVRASIDGIIHSPPGTDVDGRPSDYPNARALVRSGVGYDGLEITL